MEKKKSKFLYPQKYKKRNPQKPLLGDSPMSLMPNDRYNRGY